MSSSLSSTTTPSSAPGLANPPHPLAAAVPPPPPMPSWHPSNPPPLPPATQSLAAWGANYKTDVSIAHIEALCCGEQPTLALANCDVVEHWQMLVSH